MYKLIKYENAIFKCQPVQLHSQNNLVKKSEEDEGLYRMLGVRKERKASSTLKNEKKKASIDHIHITHLEPRQREAGQFSKKRCMACWCAMCEKKGKLLLHQRTKGKKASIGSHLDS